MLGFAIQTFRYSHMDLFSHLGCLVCGILSFVFLIYSNTFLIFWHSHKCTFSYLYFSQLGCPSFRNYQFQFYQFCHSQQEVPSFVFPSFMSLPSKRVSPQQNSSKQFVINYSGGPRLVEDFNLMENSNILRRQIVVAQKRLDSVQQLPKFRGNNCPSAKIELGPFLGRIFAKLSYSMPKVRINCL